MVYSSSKAARNELLREASTILRSPVVAVHRADKIGGIVKKSRFPDNNGGDKVLK